MNISTISSVVLATGGQAEPTSLGISFDLISAFFLMVALGIGWLVYRWTAPAPSAAHQTSKGERLMYAVVSAAAIITIGTYFGDGFGGIERVEKARTSSPTTSAVVDSTEVTNTGR